MKALTHPGQYSAARNSYRNPFSFSATWHQFITWASGQEENRFTWSAISILGHGTIFTVGTFITVMLTGNLLFLLLPTCLNMTMMLVVNLAALPTKYIIPCFFLSLLVDLVIIATALALWVHYATVYFIT